MDAKSILVRLFVTALCCLANHVHVALQTARFVVPESPPETNTVELLLIDELIAGTLDTLDNCFVVVQFVADHNNITNMDIVLLQTSMGLFTL